MLFPKLPQQTGGNRLAFSRSFFVRDVFANRVLVSGQLVWMRREKLPRLLVDLAMSLGETFANVTRDLREFEVTARRVRDRVSKRPQCSREFVIVDVLDELLRAEHLVILQRLPTPLFRIVRRIEDDAVRVQVRIERARGLMFEQRRHDVARASIGVAFRHLEPESQRSVPIPPTRSSPLRCAQ